MERGGSSGRVLLVGAALAVLIAGGIAAGLLLGGSSSPDTTPTSPATVSPTTSPANVKDQVRQAYLNYWDVYAEALLKLDTSELGDVLTAEALDIVTKQVEQQRSKNQPVRIEIEHHLRIVLINPGKASVDDRYVDRSVPLDPQTMKPSGPPLRGRIHQTYTMELVNGTWKVSYIVGYK